MQHKIMGNTLSRDKLLVVNTMSGYPQSRTDIQAGGTGTAMFTHSNNEQSLDILLDKNKRI